MHVLLEKVCAQQSLTREESSTAFARIVRGEADVVEISALLSALRCKGETAEEIAGAAQALLEAAAYFPVPDYETMDCCGTGGDGRGSLNVSTAVAFVLAAAQVPVVKHGNRAISSRSGSSDVLQALGLAVEMPADAARELLDRFYLCFLHAPQYHCGIRHAMPVRQTLKMRTVFNLLGPLVNPARPGLRLLGVYDAALCEKMALTLRALDVKRAWVVNGEVDEIALHTTSTIAELKSAEVRVLTLQPEAAGVQQVALSDLRGGDASHNARALESLLQGCGLPAYRESVAVNAGAGLLLARRVKSLREGVIMAREIIDDGAAHAVLQNLRHAQQLLLQRSVAHV